LAGKIKEVNAMVKIDLRELTKSLGPNPDKKAILKAVSQKFKEEFGKDNES
jgi:hypothetical protein